MNRIKQRLVCSVGLFLVSLATQSTAVAWMDNFCEGKVLNANYKNPENCNTYISCDLSGRAQVMPCPAGLLYTEGERPWGHCDYPTNVECDEDPVPEP
ncbi:MAG: chitin binding peritrophin-A domain-containing protein [Candidatus Binatia bacterium]